MITYFKSLLTDQTVFIGAIRAGLGIVGLGVESGKFPVPEGYEWMGLVGVGAALFMRSSSSSSVPEQPAK